MIAFPNAKINLGLHIINKREDGFHNLETTFLSVNLGDMLEVIEQKSWVNGTEKIKLTTFGIPIDGNLNDNLITKAYHLLDAQYGLPPITCCLYKNIPMGAGLGGGSSDAAFMLKLLNTKFNLNISTEQLQQYAATLGSDCAFFIENKPSYVFGKGHELTPINISLNGYYLVLVCPPIHSSTALAYKNATVRNVLTDESSIKNNILSPIENWKDTIYNDFEKSVFAQFPLLAEIKNSLYQSGAVYASMSGSGSSLFGIFKTQPNLTNIQPNWIAWSGKL